MEERWYQPFPERGKLFRNLSLEPKALSKRVERFRNEDVYCYVVSTVEYDEGRMYQTGSSPNFQGGVVTLCSCMHWMRTYRDSKDWPGAWIAGFLSCTPLGVHKLFYLMRVSEAFKSHRKLWESRSISIRTKEAKAAHLDGFGDVYEPRKSSGKRYGYRNYKAPCEGHVHQLDDLWHKDVKHTKGKAGRPSALLLGDPKFSFLWQEPDISSPFYVTRFPKVKALQELLPFI